MVCPEKVFLHCLSFMIWLPPWCVNQAGSSAWFFYDYKEVFENTKFMNSFCVFRFKPNLIAGSEGWECATMDCSSLFTNPIWEVS